MKYIFSEFLPDYDKYNFPYQVLALMEDNDSFDELFDKGLLPTRFHKNIFHLSRSVRIKLSKFELSSENRRIQRKTGDFSFEIIKISDFDYTIEVQKKCKDWMNSRFDKKIISANGVKKVFTEENNNLVFVWKTGDEIVGYVPCIDSETLVYYNYAFYNPKYHKANLGARMMLEAVLYANENGRKFIYLGSIYSRNSLYKFEFSGAEFFNGVKWSENKDELKFLLEDGNLSDEEYSLRNEGYMIKYLGMHKISDLAN